MTIKNLQVIEDALRDINVLSEIESASSEQGATGIRKLNQLMELWKENDIDLGYYAQDSTTANCPIPDWSELGVTAALSILLAPTYGANISAELAAIADSAISSIQRKTISEQLDNADMSHLPEGSGHYGNRYDIVNDR